MLAGAEGSLWQDQPIYELGWNTSFEQWAGQVVIGQAAPACLAVASGHFSILLLSLSVGGARGGLGAELEEKIRWPLQACSYCSPQIGRRSPSLFTSSLPPLYLHWSGKGDTGSSQCVHTKNQKEGRVEFGCCPRHHIGLTEPSWKSLMCIDCTSFGQAQTHQVLYISKWDVRWEKKPQNYQGGWEVGTWKTTLFVQKQDNTLWLSMLLCYQPGVHWGKQGVGKKEQERGASQRKDNYYCLHFSPTK